MHPGFHMVAVVVADGKQFDAAAEFPGKLDIDGVDVADAFPEVILDFN